MQQNASKTTLGCFFPKLLNLTKLLLLPKVVLKETRDDIEEPPDQATTLGEPTR
jgi:hypothetical protein